MKKLVLCGARVAALGAAAPASAAKIKPGFRDVVTYRRDRDAP
jgi:hypothetical protein